MESVAAGFGNVNAWQQVLGSLERYRMILVKAGSAETPILWGVVSGNRSCALPPASGNDKRNHAWNLLPPLLDMRGNSAYED